MRQLVLIPCFLQFKLLLIFRVDRLAALMNVPTCIYRCFCTLIARDSCASVGGCAGTDDCAHVALDAIKLAPTPPCTLSSFVFTPPWTRLSLRPHRPVRSQVLCPRRPGRAQACAHASVNIFRVLRYKSTRIPESQLYVLWYSFCDN